VLMRGRRLPGWSEGVGTTTAEEQTSMEEAQSHDGLGRDARRRSGTRPAQLRRTRILMC
jgi:hypothetical protein